MDTNKNLEAAIYEELYSTGLDGVTRHGDRFYGYIFQDVTVQGDLITLTYFDVGALAEAPYGFFDPAEVLAEKNAEHEERVRAIAGEGFSIAYKVKRAINAEVVTEYINARLAELAEEQ